MNIQVAVACDSATEYQNRLCILGTFDVIKTLQFPLIKPQCSIALQIAWAKSEEGPHTIKVQFMNEDGKSMLKPLESTITITVPATFLFVTTNHIINIQQFRFNKAGSYLATVFIDGKMKAEIQLQIIHVKQNA